MPVSFVIVTRAFSKARAISSLLTARGDVRCNWIPVASCTPLRQTSCAAGELDLIDEYREQLTDPTDSFDVRWKPNSYRNAEQAPQYPLSHRWACCGRPRGTFRAGLGGRGGIGHCWSATTTPGVPRRAVLERPARSSSRRAGPAAHAAGLPRPGGAAARPALACAAAPDPRGGGGVT